MLQEYKGKPNFATDAWTSLNHKAYVAITVHLEHQGHPIITAKAIIKQFNAPKSKAGRVADKAADALVSLYKELEVEEREERERRQGEDEGEEDEPLDAWTDSYCTQPPPPYDAPQCVYTLELDL
ncbi:hypothetical protein CVT26_002900 [Gymnopilus dilepis]|uniref:Uncharacterized protein n=1 Tax=Gymnopilus dilepis TaxID=231916 RepID=A0A409X1A3_9AGAR|nr:hypothetical protein CVT26_002900 [Gymnopilus dilepis]